jgi:prophage regulatory protein
MAMTDRLLKVGEVAAKISFHETTVFDMVSAGRFPAPIRLSRRASRWSEAEVDAWIEARLAERKQATPRN